MNTLLRTDLNGHTYGQVCVITERQEITLNQIQLNSLLINHGDRGT